jgi:hypothetical protein
MGRLLDPLSLSVTLHGSDDEDRSITLTLDGAGKWDRILTMWLSDDAFEEATLSISAGTHSAFCLLTQAEITDPDTFAVLITRLKSQVRIADLRARFSPSRSPSVVSPDDGRYSGHDDDVDFPWPPS